MKKNIFLILALTLFATELSASIIKGTVLVNGKEVSAEYTLLADGTVGLGSGHNACISHYTSGRIIVPPSITKGSTTYQVSKIMPMAFRLCDKIRVVIIREGITSIGNFAFVGCKSLIQVELPSTMQSIGSGVFYKLPNLVAVICKAETPPAWDYKDVCHGTVNASLFVPTGTDTAYKNANYTKPELEWTTPAGWGTSFVKIHANAMEGYHLYSQDDLNDFHELINNPGSYGAIKDVYLENDIDMIEYEWATPIGDTEAHAFTGTFHGQGNYIRNLKIINDGVAGFFGYFKGPKITGVRLDNCTFRGKQLAGGLVAQCGACTIDSCYIDVTVHTDGTGGGIVGRSTGKIIIDRCVVDGTNTNFTDGAGSPPWLGGIVARTTGATITNCALLSTVRSGSHSGAFVAECTDGTATIDYCYSANSEITEAPADTIHIIHGEHVILFGEAFSILNYEGNKIDFTYNINMLKTVYPASTIGVDGWIYKAGNYPLPDCFFDLLTIEPNRAVYGSAALAEQYTNVLAPDETIPASTWLDLTEMGFRHYKFKASQLWIDGNMDVFNRVEQLPLGLSKQITVENGILLEDTLYSKKLGTEPYYEPVYLMNEEDSTIVYDDNGNLIQIDSLYCFDKILWADSVYSICLPYNVSISPKCTLYQPSQIYDVDGETTALFEAVRDNYVEAFRPYLLVVHNDTLPLGTRAKVVCPALTSKSLRLGNYEFEGTMSRIRNIAARSTDCYMLEDENNWLLYKSTEDFDTPIKPFTAFFRSVDGTPATRIKIVLNDDNPVISVGDFYYTINNDNGDNVTAKLVGYHGTGGNVVVPPTAPYVSFGMEHQVPLTELAPDIFTKNKSVVWSIDFSQCSNLQPVTIDRNEPGNPFYGVDERTIIYMPEGIGQAGRNNVIGTECQQLDITDGWDFVPPYDFHADEAAYDRILYAAKQQDGSYLSKTYTICLPFTVDLERRYNENLVNVYQLYYLNNDKELLFYKEIPAINAGTGYVVKVISGSVELSATDVQILAQTTNDFDVYSWNDNAQNTGVWKGTFTQIDNEQSALMNAFTLYSNGKWYRIRSDEGRYRNAWVGAFRAYYSALDTPVYNTYSTVIKPGAVGGWVEEPITPFSSDFFTADADFSRYDDETTGVTTIKPSIDWEGVDAWFTLDGRKLSERPHTKGLYIHKGKKIIIK